MLVDGVLAEQLGCNPQNFVKFDIGETFIRKDFANHPVRVILADHCEAQFQDVLLVGGQVARSYEDQGLQDEGHLVQSIADHLEVLFWFVFSALL